MRCKVKPNQLNHLPHLNQSNKILKMTVKDLKQYLESFPDDAIVMGTYEATLTDDLETSNIYTSRDGVVIIDLDSNLYFGKWQQYDAKTYKK